MASYTGYVQYLKIADSGTAFVAVGPAADDAQFLAVLFDSADTVRECAPGTMHPLQAALWEGYQIEVPIINWHGRRLIRVSCHLYNTAEDFDKLAAALKALLR